MTLTNEEGKFSINLHYFTTFPGVMNLLIVIALISLFIQTKEYDGLEIYGKDLIERTSYIELNKVVEYYNSIFDIESVAVFLVLIRLVYFTRLFKQYAILWASLEKAGAFLIRYAITLVPIFFSFSIAGMIMFGPVTLEFATIGDSFISVLAMIVGQLPTSVYDVGDGTYLIAYLTVFYFFMMFCVITFFAAIFIDSYRVTTMEQGLSEEKQQQAFCEWFLDWGPYTLVEKFMEEQNPDKANLHIQKRKTLGDKIWDWIRVKLKSKSNKKPPVTKKKTIVEDLKTKTVEDEEQKALNKADEKIPDPKKVDTTPKKAETKS